MFDVVISSFGAMSHAPKFVLLCQMETVYLSLSWQDSEANLAAVQTTGCNGHGIPFLAGQTH